ncbi:MAG: hypothetical protein IMZ44_25390, partial [Planctomycetes bacterium]|nr:hypothetical protein [Planctomycetota bacterium]
MRILSAGALVVAILAAPAASAEPAAPPAAPEAAAQPAMVSEAPDTWGPPGGGLAARLAVEGDVAAGGKMRITLSLRSAAGQPVTLPPAKDIFGWLLAAQSTPGSKKALYTEQIFFARGSADWPAEISGARVLTFKAIDVSDATAYASENARALLLSYVSGKAEEPLPKPAGKLSQLLMPGKAGAKFTAVS